MEDALSQHPVQRRKGQAVTKQVLIADTGRFNISRYRNYDYFHHWTGHSIAVLPMIVAGASLASARKGDIESICGSIHDDILHPKEDFYGLRQEDLPCWQADEPEDNLHWTCVTGGVDQVDYAGRVEEITNIELANAMLRELKEEMGLELIDYNFVSEGPMRTSKGTNLKVTHIWVVVRAACFVDPKPDSEFEARAMNFWLTKKECKRKFELFDLHTRNLLRMAGVK